MTGAFQHHFLTTRWVVFLLVSGLWVCLGWFAWTLARGGLFNILSPALETVEPRNRTVSENPWSQAFSTGGDSGWEWMVAVSEGSLANPEELSDGLRVRVPASAWFPNCGGAIPLRRMVGAKGGTSAELWAVMGPVEDLIRVLAGADGCSVEKSPEIGWKLTRGLSVWEIIWLPARSAPNPGGHAVNGWVLIRLVKGA